MMGSQAEPVDAYFRPPRSSTVTFTLEVMPCSRCAAKPQPPQARSFPAQYTGALDGGTKFDSSRARGQPFSFPPCKGRVIQGWDFGVAGMKVGGQRKLIIPPEEGYGARGAGGSIPPNATLEFHVELL